MYNYNKAWKYLFLISPLLLANCATAPVDKLGPSDVVARWLVGDDGHLYFGPNSEMSKKFSQGRGAKTFEDFFYNKYSGGPAQADRVDNFDYTFTWFRAIKSWNLAEQVVGSWHDGVAEVVDDQLVCRIENVMSLRSLLFGRQLWQMGMIDPKPGEGDLRMTIEWTAPLRD